MLKFNDNNINGWCHSDSNIIKVYRNDAILYYRVSLNGTQEPCYAVVNDISQYQDTEFIDVFNKADGKWYKLNNLDNYEEYGVYGSGRNITYYDGKLTIDDGYEYQYSGNSWVNVGEVSGSSRVPEGYTELTYAQTIKQTVQTSQIFTVPIDLQSNYNYIFEFTPLNWEESYYGLIIGGNDSNSSASVFWKWGIYKFDNGWGTEWYRTNNWFWNYKLESRNGGGATGKYRFYSGVRAKVTNHLHNYDVSQGADIIVENEGYDAYTANSTTTASTNTIQTGVYNIPLFTANLSAYETAYLQFHNLRVETSGGTAVYDYIPVKRNSDDKVGLYDLTNDAVYIPSGITLNAGADASPVEYPVYYTEMQDPPNNVSFSSMTEAEQYECPYVGLKATIAGDKYIFTESGGTYYWEAVQGGLPDVPFMLNYNAKNYDASTYTIAKTEGQLRDVDAVCNYGYNIVDHSADGYITITGNTRMNISGTTYFGRNNNESGCTMTIVSKVRTSSGYSILTNRGNTSSSQMNWMWRYPTTGIFLHGSSSYNNPLYSVSTTGSPVTASIRTYYDSGVKQKLRDHTNNGSYDGAFGYGSEYNGNSSLFCDYANRASEFWQGDFYWVYMSFNVLTDDEIQQVIDYNENL
jgi:hypothetical protein